MVRFKSLALSAVAQAMSAELDRALRRTLRLRSGSTNVLHNREGSSLEFKKAFNLGGMPEYARTMLAFGNNCGGYLVFGVDPSPHRLRGVNPVFKTVDPARISSFLRDHAAPEPNWEMGELTFHGVELGYIYTHEGMAKPFVVTGSAGNDLKDGEVYYRYRGQSTRVRHAELEAIIHARLDAERRAWLDHLRAISRAGPLNVGVLDTAGGTLTGTGGQFLIEESLLQKIRFIREGRFVETSGDPALRLIGDVQPVGGVVARQPVGVGIHAEDLIAAFLTQEKLEPIRARSFLRETAFQNTPYSPLHYYISLARISRAEAIELLKSAATGNASTRKRLAERLRDDSDPGYLGTVGEPQHAPEAKSALELLTLFGKAEAIVDQRTLLLRALQERPEVVRQALAQLPLVRVAEAISHLKAANLARGSEVVFGILHDMLTASYLQMDGNTKTTFRKTVAALDLRLFAS